MTVLEVKGLGQRFGGVEALADVSFDVAAGERLAIIGPNGAGKTTLFNCLIGQPPPTTGEVTFNGEVVTRMPPYRRASRGLARSFQTVSPFGNLTVHETAMIAVSGRRSTRYRISRRLDRLGDHVEEARRIIDRAGLLEHSDVQLRMLSYGEQRRLDLALATAGDPQLYLLDEPSAGLTSAESDSIVTMVRSMPSEVAVVLIDHDMDVVFRVAERILVLHHGRLIAEGTVDEIRASQAVRDVYFGGEFQRA